MRAENVGQSLDKQVGRKIRAARSSFPSMTIELAAKFVGVTPEHFRAFEAGEERPTGDQLVLLADLLSVEPGWFFRDGEDA